ncbi:MAG: hypothetical protein WCJ62_13070 [Flavobacterium sp.]
MDLYDKLLPEHKSTLENLKFNNPKNYDLTMTILKRKEWFVDLPLDEIVIVTNQLNIDVNLSGIINAFKQ